MSSPKRTKRLLAALSLLLILAAALYSYLFLLLRRSESRAAELATGIEAASKRQWQLDALRSVVRETAASRLELSEYLLPSDGTVAFISSVEALGRSSGASVELSDISANPLSGDGASLQTLGAEVTARGSFESVFRFLSRLESVPYRVSVAKATIRKEAADPSATGTPLWKGTFRITVLQKN